MTWRISTVLTLTLPTEHHSRCKWCGRSPLVLQNWSPSGDVEPICEHHYSRVREPNDPTPEEIRAHHPA